MNLTLIRGLPGAGKTTLANKIRDGHMMAGEDVPLIIEADHYYEVGGVGAMNQYFYDPRWLKEAHQRAQRLTERALYDGFNVIVPGTFSRHWELEKYMEFGPMVSVNVVACAGQYVNIHNCPDDVIKRMAMRWETWEGELIVDE